MYRFHVYVVRINIIHITHLSCQFYIQHSTPQLLLSLIISVCNDYSEKIHKTIQTMNNIMLCVYNFQIYFCV